jgi:hypothetical protein
LWITQIRTHLGFSIDGLDRSHQRFHHPLLFMKRTDATSSSHCQAPSYDAANAPQYDLAYTAFP